MSQEKPVIEIQGKALQKEEIPTYLGVVLDPKLTLNEQMKKVETKAKNRLKLVKKLASTSWGADKSTLRQLYLGYVRSTMDYSLALQSVSSKTTQLSVDRVQNNALRFISGAMRTTQTAVCEVHTNVEPLNIRREAAVIETVERIRRQDKAHPNRRIVDGHKSDQRLKKRSILSISDKLKKPINFQRKESPSYSLTLTVNHQK